MRFKKFDIQPNDRIHMTDEPKLTFRNRRSVNNSFNSGIGKPAGLWYAMGRTWLEWMDSEKMSWWKKYLYKVEINPEKILFLDTEEKIKSLMKIFPNEIKGHLDWKKISKQYSGVEFNPYFYNLRLKSGYIYGFYYSGIDIPSGCIWDKTGIKSITRLN